MHSILNNMIKCYQFKEKTNCTSMNLKKNSFRLKVLQRFFDYYNFLVGIKFDCKDKMLMSLVTALGANIIPMNEILYRHCFNTWICSSLFVGNLFVNKDKFIITDIANYLNSFIDICMNNRWLNQHLVKRS